MTTEQSKETALASFLYVKRVHDFTLRQIAADNRGTPMPKEEVVLLLHDGVQLWRRIKDELPPHIKEAL